MLRTERQLLRPKIMVYEERRKTYVVSDEQDFGLEIRGCG